MYLISAFVLQAVATLLLVVSTILLIVGNSPIKVTVHVTGVPRFYTPLQDNLYMAASFNGWNPKDGNTRLYRTSPASSFRVDLWLKCGDYEFKFTRGSQETVEVSSDGREIENRLLKVSLFSSKDVHVTIENWKDMVGPHTASENTYMLSYEFPFPQMNKTKKIGIYLPPDYFHPASQSRRYPVLYLHDGQEAFDQFFCVNDVNYDQRMDDFYARTGLAAIMVALFSDHDRVEELTPFPNYNQPTGSVGGKGDLYIDFLALILKPFIDQHFRTLPDRNNTAISGYALGGLMSLYAGMKYQRIFGKIGAFSATYLFNETIYSYVQQTPAIFAYDIKFYCIVGASEVTSYQGTVYDMVATMNRMVNLLRSLGYLNVVGKIYQDGAHDRWFWNRELPLLFDYFFSS